MAAVVEGGDVGLSVHAEVDGGTDTCSSGTLGGQPPVKPCHVSSACRNL